MANTDPIVSIIIGSDMHIHKTYPHNTIYGIEEYSGCLLECDFLENYTYKDVLDKITNNELTNTETPTDEEFKQALKIILNKFMNTKDYSFCMQIDINKILND